MTNYERPRQLTGSAKEAVVELLDARGQVLAECELEAGPFTREVVVRRVLRGHGALLAHHFSSSRGIVTMRVGGRGIPVRLVTHWQGHRRVWRLIPVAQQLGRAG